VGDVVVAAIDGPRADDRERRLVGAHLADLHVAGVRAQEHARPGPEAVLHVGRRVIRREGELREVVLLQLDLRPADDQEAEIPEDREQVGANLRDRVHVAAVELEATGQRQIEGPGSELRFTGGSREGSQPVGERDLHLFLESVDARPDRRAIRARDVTHERQHRGEITLLAKDLGVLGSQRLLGRGRSKSVVEPAAQGVEALLDRLDGILRPAHVAPISVGRLLRRR
jgi:hypothetical protein